MKKIQIENDIIVYQFPPDKGKFLGLNITVIYAKEEYLLIDAGYRKHMKELLPELEGKRCKAVLCTHFHPDHTDGIYELGNVKVIGSIHGLQTLKVFKRENDEFLTPNVLIDSDFDLIFHNHHINISLNQGHSVCGTIITVDDRFMFTGDDVMFDNDKNSVIPFLAEHDPYLQEQALLRILTEVKGKMLIPAHGSPTDNYTFIEEDINHKLLYLDYVKRKTTFREFKHETNITFLGDMWHKFNITDPE